MNIVTQIQAIIDERDHLAVQVTELREQKSNLTNYIQTLEKLISDYESTLAFALKLP